MRIVVKVGTSTLAHSTGRLNIRHTEELVKVLSDLKNAGHEVILVSSGAIGMGVGKLSLSARPTDMSSKQACAAVGQCELMYTYDRLFSAYDHTVAQILLTGVDIEHASRRENIQNTLTRLLELGALPIINENDTVATDEITSIGDNDTLAAIVTCCIKADLLVLAISHPPPSLPAQAEAWRHHPALIANPWQPGALDAIAPHARVAVMGTGLTMADTVATLDRLGHRGSIVAFSRHGLLSRGNLSGAGATWPGDYQQGSLRQRLRQIRLDVAYAAQQGLSWQVVLDAVRQQGQRIWQALSVADRQRFLRHLRHYWDVHRYRVAPQVAEVLEARQRTGSLQVQAARLLSISGEGETLRLTLARRGGGVQTLSVDHLILTTGPAHRALTDSQPFLQDLARRGLIRADALGMGLEVDSRSRAVAEPHVEALPVLVAGPAARGRFGELMGLPQVADHAADVAAQALLTLGIPQDSRCPAY